MFTNFVEYQAFREAVLRLYQTPLRAKATRYKMAQAIDSFAVAAHPGSTSDITTQAVADWVAGLRVD